jgi:hypothetical protein
VTAQISAGDAVAGGAQFGSQESIGGSQVPHAWNKNDERADSADVVANSTLRSYEI